MNSFPQLPGEPADAFEQLLLHRDFGPSRQFSQTADEVGCSESTLRRRAEQWDWPARLAEYDASLLQQVSQARRQADLERYETQLETFRLEQVERARIVGGRAEELLAMVERRRAGFSRVSLAKSQPKKKNNNFKVILLCLFTLLRF